MIDIKRETEFFLVPKLITVDAYGRRVLREAYHQTPDFLAVSNSKLTSDSIAVVKKEAHTKALERIAYLETQVNELTAQIRQLSGGQF